MKKIISVQLCESALEDLINMIDSRKRVGNILKVGIHSLCNDCKCTHSVLSQNHCQEGESSADEWTVEGGNDGGIPESQEGSN